MHQHQYIQIHTYLTPSINKKEHHLNHIVNAISVYNIVLGRWKFMPANSAYLMNFVFGCLLLVFQARLFVARHSHACICVCGGRTKNR